MTTEEIKKEYTNDLKKFRDFIRKNPSLLSSYVYVLVDPRGEREQVFYVGKGQTTRMFSHVLDSFNPKHVNNENGWGEKLERIKSIHDDGYKVKMYILHYGLTDEHAFIVESVLIDVFKNFRAIDAQAIGELTNSINGFDHKRGFCDVDTLYKNSKVFERIKRLPGEKILLIKISGTETDNLAILERVRKHWKLNPERANKASFIAACCNGVIVGLYKNDTGWKPSSIIEDPNNEGRYYFEGRPVTDSAVLERYVNRLVDIPKGARYPVMYLGGWR